MVSPNAPPRVRSVRVEMILEILKIEAKLGYCSPENHTNHPLAASGAFLPTLRPVLVIHAPTIGDQTPRSLGIQQNRLRRSIVSVLPLQVRNCSFAKFSTICCGISASMAGIQARLVSWKARV
jgi:hypothetical protein